MAPPVQLPTRRLGRDGPAIPAIGFGLMGLSTAYGTPAYVFSRTNTLPIYPCHSSSAVISSC